MADSGNKAGLKGSRFLYTFASEPLLFLLFVRMPTWIKHKLCAPDCVCFPFSPHTHRFAC